MLLPSRLSALALVFALFVIPGCGEDGPDTAGAVAACQRACDKQKTACPTYTLCDALCNAYKITADTEKCVAAIKTLSACEEAQTYTCLMNFPVPGDTNACNAQQMTYMTDC